MTEDGKEVSDMQVDLETRIIQLCQQNPNGVTDKLMQAEISGTTVKERAHGLNRLLSQDRLEILKQGKQLLYRLKTSDNSQKVKGADNEEKIVYQIIEDAGNKGIWIRDIRFKSNLLLTQVNKVLKSLEGKKLIKAVKSVSASKKKVYMLYNLEPDRSITGGAWYSDQDFESEFVEVLNQQCFKFLQQKLMTAREATNDPISERNASYASSKDIWKFINELGISKVTLSAEDIEAILDTLIYDGKVEKTIVASQVTSGSTGGMTRLYRAVEPLIESTGLMRLPCGVCPVMEECQEGGAISPSNCLYMKQWLDY
ncbi:DNA-directed RNA polymerase III subunit RPC6-like isoform X1 [Limulus polyphemus]|uniref:DNA-directed RNA polymerase III subunit RPC6 n=1 Tax=Limulus polyphemus TaxID=6850 RepID=A0ABM1BKK3_LIMPO|nr:DNA-directed RNA polymerase III subunit RPC6-like isoform X1 [Limulus polyphemus]XP_022251981.1 DNA-directed RNA polymerase III subunit RPC6-like isoform X1 [Limulus polyphemus]XP_022251982.1 DNA-directed RNA polymerase III subunit RPC6-like isoform X1 [Limulus polyphemus]XP_022251983.1 DNA-directed RNA polymerase III subunit RPC6-like isoform X1 [Limulus polyphemus]XP_022251984.1 DNA-directed RNA polymerase III subunit RPC6-like isoform X1 [Limulus polyphemus]